MNTFVLLLQVGVVFAIFAASMWALKRYGSGPRSHRREDTKVLARLPLAQGATMTVVQVGDTTLALGVTGTNVTLLREVTLPATDDEPAPDSDTTDNAEQSTATTFGQRFIAALESQGKAPATLGKAIAHTTKAFHTARTSTSAPTSEKQEKSGADFAAALAAAGVTHPDPTPGMPTPQLPAATPVTPADPDERARAIADDVAAALRDPEGAPQQ